MTDLVPVLPAEVRIVRTFWLITHADLAPMLRIRVTSDFIAEEVQKAALVVPAWRIARQAGRNVDAITVSAQLAVRRRAVIAKPQAAVCAPGETP